MAMIECPECKSKVSSKAASCPHCGCPIATQKASSKKPGKSNEPVYTVQKTAKKYKAMIVIGFVLVIGGCSASFDEAGTMEQDTMETTTILTIAGFVLLLFGIIGKWWHHD